MTREFNTKPGEYVLYFQKGRYTGTQIENCCKNNTDFVEFVPGIYFRITKNKIHGIKKFIIDFCDSYKGDLKLIKMIGEQLYEKWGTNHVEVTFKNIRDKYSLCTKIEEMETTLYSNDKATQGGCFIDYHKYKSTNNKPVYTMVKTSDIMFSESSGGDGNRCSLKGILGIIGIFSAVYDNEYLFLTEYEMHCVADESDLLKKLCQKTPGCKNTVQRMKEGTFVGPTEDNHLDGLCLSKYGDKYIIDNGNHRTCCAKLFGIEEVKACVHYFEECEDDEKYYMPNIDYNYKTKYDNEKVLKTFYQVFKKNGLSEEDARTYLEEDGSNIGLITLYKNKLLNFQ